MIRHAGLTPLDRKGMVFNPVSWRWSLSLRDLSVNYVDDEMLWKENGVKYSKISRVKSFATCWNSAQVAKFC